MPFDPRFESAAVNSSLLKHSPSDIPQHRAASASSTESQAVISNAPLKSCVYIALRCQVCGELRQALAAVPQSELVACPECSRPCDFVQLGSGFTRKQLPFHEIYPGDQTPEINPLNEST